MGGFRADRATPRYKCAFCAGWTLAVFLESDEFALVHSLPHCKLFVDLDAHQYLEASSRHSWPKS